MYSREIDDEVLLITTSGFTYFSQHVLYDENTGSLWFHMGGTNDLTCIAGRYEGRILRGVRDFMTGPWHIWKYSFPGTKYLKAQPR